MKTVLLFRRVWSLFQGGEGKEDKSGKRSTCLLHRLMGAIHSRLTDGRSKGSEALHGDVCSENHTQFTLPALV